MVCGESCSDDGCVNGWWILFAAVGSKTEAAQWFKLVEASVYRWLKPSGMAYQRPGPRRSHQLDWSNCAVM